ncbi:MAG: DEAD/DEAH box helicase [Bacteroidetes bacterium]|jgi:superfamily II DNA/RNA helicase|nr:DEAD/DEAH box helicase [Bacteroidota bacterium]
MKFDEFDLDTEIIEAIGYMGFKEATPIQEKSIPIILAGIDLVGCAQTGTGKTAAFLLPTIQKIASLKDKQGSQALIVAPTRELAIQIEQQVQALGYFAGISSFAVYGGGGADDWVDQKKALRSGADIIVATPGKLISHINTKDIQFDNLKMLILDEADRMLDIGFYEDILKIIEALPKKRQTLMFSATMDKKIRKLASKILYQPEEITIAISKPAEGVLQAAYCVYEKQKIDLVHQLITDKPNYESILIFCSTKKKVSDLSRTLKRKKYSVGAISSDLDQTEREKMLNSFRAKNTRVLVGTDVVSRGIDIKDINLVINFDVPSDAEDYVHRIGRTARANTTGVALTFISPRDMRDFAKIEELIEREVPKAPLPPEIGKGPSYNPNQKSSQHRAGGNRKSSSRSNRKHSRGRGKKR